MSHLPFWRATGVIALVTAPVLAAVSVVLQPDLGNSSAQRLDAMADGSLPAVSAVAFLLSQLPMMLAFVVIGLLLRTRAPRLSAWGATLGVLGAFGHTVFGGTSMIYLAMARDRSHRTTYISLMDSLNNGPVMLFSVLGLAGTVLGLLLVSIGVFRAGIGPRWVGPALWAFLLVEFVVSGISRYASYLSVILFAAAFLALAAELRRTPENVLPVLPTTAL